MISTLLKLIFTVACIDLLSCDKISIPCNSLNLPIVLSMQPSAYDSILLMHFVMSILSLEPPRQTINRLVVN